MGSLIVTLLLTIGPIIIDVLFKFLEKKYGGAVMGLAMENISSLEKQKRAGTITAAQAEDTNVKAIKKATAMSPGLNTSIAKFINLIVYMRYVKDAYPDKFRNWCANITNWTSSGKRIRYSKDY